MGQLDKPVKMNVYGRPNRAGRPVFRFASLSRPKFLSGVLFDVWFYPYSAERSRVKIAITTEPSMWRGELGATKLDDMVRERFAGRLIDAKYARLCVTSRPGQKKVVDLRWGGLPSEP